MDELTLKERFADPDVGIVTVVKEGVLILAGIKKEISDLTYQLWCLDETLRNRSAD